MTKPFHIRIHGIARAFVVPETMWERVVLYFRGWRKLPFGPTWGSKLYGETE